MGLPARQRRILETIENSLRHSDPRLIALFAVFSRLNLNEEMPRIEEIRHRAALLFLPVRRRVLAAIGWLRAKPGTRTRAAPFLPAGVRRAGSIGRDQPEILRRIPVRPQARCDQARPDQRAGAVVRAGRDQPAPLR